MTTSSSTPFVPYKWTNLFAAAAIAIDLAVYLVLPFLFHLRNGIGAEKPSTRMYEVRDCLITFSVWIAAYLLLPVLASLYAALRPRWRPAYSVSALASACAFIAAFVFYFGNRQFGLYDFGIMIDTGWRQILGQRPYVDFFTATPPGFNLGIKYAFQAFGVNWDAQLYATMLLAVVSFLWLYWLLCGLTRNRMIAFWVAFAAETAINLDLSFWWYNNETQTFVLLFYLSCLLLCLQPRSLGTQLSYYFSLWPLMLMKPNMAATVGFCGIVLTLCAARATLRVILLSLAAGATTLLFLFLNHVSIPAMLANYHAAAIEHGFTLFGLRIYNRVQMVVVLFWTLALSLPLVALLPECRSVLQQGLWRKLAFLLFFPAILVLTAYGFTTNSDLADLQLSSLFVVSFVALFGVGMPKPRPLLRGVYVALLIAMLASDLYAGVMRWRVHGIGPGQFFEWGDSDRRINSSFFSDLHASSEMSTATEQIDAAVAGNQGPFFFGPRLELSYALHRLPSPDHMAVVWEPGTFFARRDQGKLIQTWQQHNYRTLIFLKDDYTFYTPELLALIHSEYTRDDSYPQLTVYHALAHASLDHP